MAKDYYDILGVSKNSSKDELKSAYKKLAIKYHPDRAPEDKKEEYEEHFKEVNQAYSTLSDDSKRRTYDSLGPDNYQDSPNGFGGGATADFSDILREVFGGAFGGVFGGNPFGGGNIRQGEDLQVNVTISFEESAFGVEKDFKIKRKINCKTCEGTGSKDKKESECSKCKGNGRVQIERRTPFGTIRQATVCDNCDGIGTTPKNPCKKCKGKGVVEEKETITIKVPAGIDNGQGIRMEGKGDLIKNGSAGDLIIHVLVEPHEIFNREGQNIYMEKYVNFTDLSLGAEIDIPTLSGDVKLKIQEGTESGTTLRLKGKGFQSLHSYGVGDQFINIKAKTPKRLSRKQEKLWRELRDLD